MANKVKTEIELDLKDDALRDAKKQLDDFAKKYEALRTLRATFAQAGKFSSGFVLVDEELKKSLKNVGAAKDGYLKALKEYESKSAPLLKRTGGVLHRLWYGNDVGTPEQADKEERKVTQRVSAFQRHMQGALALSSAVAKTLIPLPGGEVLHAGIEGASSGASKAMTDPETGETRTGLRGVLGGVAGGLKGAGVAAALALLAKGVSGAVQGSREKEELRLTLAQAAGGDLGIAQSAIGLAEGGLRRTVGGRLEGNPFLAPEAAPIIGGVLQAGGGAQAAETALRAQLVAGQGGAITSLFGGLAQAGATKLDASAQRLWIEMNATAVAQGIKKGRIGELIVGAQSVAAQRPAGTTLGEPSEIFRFAAQLGQKEAFKGRRGFETMGRLETFARGESSPMARAFSLMQSGLGGNVSMVEAMRRSERGIFGEGGMGVEGVKEMVERVRQAAGGDRDQASLLLSRTAGLGINEATELLDLVQKGGFGQKELETFKEKAKTTEEKAFESLAGMNWQGIDKTLEAINRVLGQLLLAIGGLAAVLKVLETTLAGLQELQRFVTDVKNKGWQAAFEKTAERAGLTGDVSAGQAVPEGWRKQTVGDITGAAAWKGIDFKDPEVREAMNQMLGTAGGTRNRVDPAMYQDLGGHVHFVLELKDDQGITLRRQEVEARWESGQRQISFRPLGGGAGAAR